MLFPNPVGLDDPTGIHNIRGYHKFKDFNWPSNGYFHLHGQWSAWYDLPPGYDYYVLSWHMEYIDFAWLKRQTVDRPILLLCDYNIYTIFFTLFY